MPRFIADLKKDERFKTYVEKFRVNEEKVQDYKKFVEKQVKVMNVEKKQIWSDFEDELITLGLVPKKGKRLQIDNHDQLFMADDDEPEINGLSDLIKHILTH